MLPGLVWDLVEHVSVFAEHISACLFYTLGSCT